MESAGALAKETGFVDQAIEFYRRASELFLQCGKVQPSGDALVRGARYAWTVLPGTTMLCSSNWNSIMVFYCQTFNLP